MHTVWKYKSLYYNPDRLKSIESDHCDMCDDWHDIYFIKFRLWAWVSLIMVCFGWVGLRVDLISSTLSTVYQCVCSTHFTLYEGDTKWIHESISINAANW